MDRVGSSFLPFCGNAGPAGIALAHQIALLPHPPMQSLMLASVGIAEDGLGESAPGPSQTPSCGFPAGSGTQVRTAAHMHSKEFVSFAATGSSRCIPSGKSAHGADPQFQFRTEFEASTPTPGGDTHIRVGDFPLASGAVWCQANGLVTEDRGVCSVSPPPQAESSSGQTGSSSPTTPYSAHIQTALKLDFTVDSFIQSSILNGNRIWVCCWLLCSHRPFSRKDRAVAHVARVHVGTKIYSCGAACGNPKCLASFVSKDNLHAHMNPVYAQCSFCLLSLLKKNLRRHAKSCRGHSRTSKERSDIQRL